MPLISPTRFYQPRGAFDPAVVAGFSGVGDVQSGAAAWYGLRAYNAAYATGSNPALIIVDQAGANDLTVNILATGALDVASIATWVTANSVSTIRVKQIHDHIGTRHLLAGGILAQMPKLVLSGFGSLPIINFDAPATQFMSASASSLGFSTYSISTVAKRNSGTSLGIIFGNENANGTIYFNGANTAGLFAGGTADFGSGSVTDGSFWTLQGYFSGASSSIGQYGATATGSLNCGNSSMGTPGLGNTGFPATMHWVEGGIWTGDKSATFNAVNTNAKAYWGH